MVPQCNHLTIAPHRFRWVFCQLEILRRTLPAHIRSALNDMPKTLDETYKHALLAIDEEMRQYAQRLFQCLAVSTRPLRTEELAEILAVRFDVGALPKFNPDWRLGDAEEAVLSVCSNLISVVDVGGSQVVQFSHFSVKEFLTSDRLATASEDLAGYHIVPHSAHTILAQASLSVLLQLDDHIDKDSIKKFPLSGYAAQHWVDHGRFENVSSTIQVAMKHLFNPDRPHFSTWVWIYDIDDPWRGKAPTSHPERPQATPLYYAVLCGFRGLIEHLIATYPKDVDARGGYYESPLFAAFVKEDIDTALLLLQRGADTNILDKRGVGHLHRASQGGRLDIVRLLLEHNADIDLPDTVDGDTPLGWASDMGEMTISRLFLQRGAAVNSRNKLGASPLLGAARNGHLDIARLLIDSGAAADSRNNSGRTPLYVASQNGHVKVAELLIQRGADVDSRDNDGWTPLHSASKNGHANLARLLIQHGADANSRSRSNLNWTPLHSASDSGQVKIAELLIQHGADVGSRGDDGWTALHSASCSGCVELTELLIRHGADVPSHTNNGWTALHSAASKGHVKIAELLIRHGGDVGARDNYRRTPLHVASENVYVKMAKLFIQHGADVDLHDIGGWAPLHWASQSGHVEFAELLIQNGADVASRNNKGWTPLHSAALQGHLDIVTLLLNCGADRDIRNHDDKTPWDLASDHGKLEVANFLSLSATSPDGVLDPSASSVNPHEDVQHSLFSASENGQFDVVRSLLEHGADVDETDSVRRTALLVVSSNGKLQVAKLLIEHGANVNSRDADGWTPLHMASRHGHLDVVRLLLDHNADLNASPRNLRTPLDIASHHGYREIVELLLDRGADANARNVFGRTPGQEALAHGYARVSEFLSQYSARET